MSTRSFVSLLTAACLAMIAIWGGLICPSALAQSPDSSAQTLANVHASKINPRLVTTFDPSWFAESITADPHGNFYVSLSSWITNRCQVARVTPDGEQKVFATFPSDVCPPNGFLLGVAFDEHNRLHVASATSAGPPSGVYRVEDNGELTLVLSLPPQQWPQRRCLLWGGSVRLRQHSRSHLEKAAPGQHLRRCALVPKYSTAGSRRIWRKRDRFLPRRALRRGLLRRRRLDYRKHRPHPPPP